MTRGDRQDSSFAALAGGARRQSPSSRSFRRGPLGVSVAVHLLLFAGFAYLPGPRMGPAESLSGIDTRVREKDWPVISLDIDFEPAPPRTSPRVITAQQQGQEESSPASQVPQIVGVPPPAPNAGTTEMAGNAGVSGEAPFFDVPTETKSVVFVIDRSGSMGAQGRLDRARRELARSLDRLPESSRFQVILYNRRAEPLLNAGSTGLVLANAENKAQALRRLAEVVPEGSTDHLPALRLALICKADAIYFLTDADDLQAYQVRALTQLNHGRSAIHTVEMTLENRGKSDMPLQVLARGNRGTYRAVASP